MKLTRLFLIAAALSGSALVLSAGPGPQFWNRPVAKPAPKQTAVAPATTADAVACVTCSCCKAKS